MWKDIPLPWGPLVLALLLALAGPAANLLLATEPPKRTLIRSVPTGNVYSYENAAGETVEEMENRQGKLISWRFYRPAPPACAYLHSVDLGTGRYWRDDDERAFHCLSPMTPLGTATEPYGLKNNLAYYVDGDAERIHQMVFKLNVNQRHEARQAHQALQRGATGAFGAPGGTAAKPRRQGQPTAESCGPRGCAPDRRPTPDPT